MNCDRVVIACLNNAYAGWMIEPLIMTMPERIAEILIPTTYYGKLGLLRSGIRVVRQSGLRFVMGMLCMRILERKEPTPRDLAKRYGITVTEVQNINSQRVQDGINRLGPSLLISANFNQYVGKKVREIPNIACINIHKALLPRNRGMAPSFYALLNNDSHTGVTIHRLVKGIDQGNIIAQRKIRIRDGDTVRSLNRRTSELGGECLLDLLTTIDEFGHLPEEKPQDETLASEHSLPTPQEVSAFYRNGNRFCT